MNLLRRARALASNESVRHLLQTLHKVDDYPSSTITGVAAYVHYDEVIPTIQAILTTVDIIRSVDVNSLGPRLQVSIHARPVDDEGHWEVGWTRLEWDDLELTWKAYVPRPLDHTGREGEC